MHHSTPAQNTQDDLNESLSLLNASERMILVKSEHEEIEQIKTLFSLSDEEIVMIQTPPCLLKKEND